MTKGARLVVKNAEVDPCTFGLGTLCPARLEGVGLALVSISSAPLWGGGELGARGTGTTGSSIVCRHPSPRTTIWPRPPIIVQRSAVKKDPRESDQVTE